MMPGVTRTAREAWRKLSHLAPGRRDATDNYLIWRIEDAWRRFSPIAIGRGTKPAQLVDPLFLVGTMRGGTTLLARCLGSHPEISLVGYELAAQWNHLCGLGMAVTGLPRWPSCPAWTAEQATCERTARIRDAFARLAARAGKPRARFLNKNPHLWNKLTFLKSVFPDARLIVASRDLRSTVASLKRFFAEQNRTRGSIYDLPENPDDCWHLSTGRSGAPAERTFPGGRARVLAEYWLRVYERIDRHRSFFAACVPVRHRDLIADPTAVLDAAQRALGLTAAPIRLPEALDPHRNDGWENVLTAAERDDLAAFIAGHRDRIQRLQGVDSTL